MNHQYSWGRRQILTGLGAGAVLAAAMPLRLRANTTTTPAAVTPEFARLADALQTAWIDYEEKFYAHPFHVSWGNEFEGAPPDVRIALARLWDCMLPILRGRARSRGDVVLKYHVLDQHFRVPTPARLIDDAPGGYFEWCVRIEGEAEAFDVPLHRFWGPYSGSFAAIDDVSDRTKPEWALIDRWIADATTI